MKTKNLILALLGIILLGIIGVLISKLSTPTPYQGIGTALASPYSLTQHEILDGETVSLSFLSPNTVLSLDVDTFQSEKTLDNGLNDITVVELTFKNTSILSLRIALYDPANHQMIDAGSLGF